MFLRFVLILAATLAVGCNVFFATDSVELGDQSNAEPNATPNGGTNVVSGGCGSTCTCENDCARTCSGHCNVTCERGACEVEAGSGADVKCEGESDCFVDCRGGSCSVTCEEGASCILRCAPQADSCDFAECEAGARDCPGREKTCNSSCPR